MLIWCSFCQSLMRETPPFFRYSLSHSVCADCEANMKQGREIVYDERIVDFFQRMLDAGQRGDIDTGLRLRDEGLQLGLSPADLVFAGVSAVLDEVGQRWQQGHVTVDDEHRATLWCTAFLDGMPRKTFSGQDLDVYGTVTPSNIHVLGPMLAEYLLRDRGLKVQVGIPALPLKELLHIARVQRPRVIVISCALPTAIAEARQMINMLLADGYAGRLLVTGSAVRFSNETWEQEPFSVARTVWDVMDAVGQAPLPDARATQ